MITKILLPEDQIPRQWYNIIPDMPGPLSPVISPRTMQPVTPEEMLASDDPVLHQFLHAEPEGPIPFHYPALPIGEQLGLNQN